MYLIRFFNHAEFEYIVYYTNQTIHFLLYLFIITNNIMLDLITIKEVKTNIGSWCRMMRKAENLTKQDLAQELELSRFTIAKLENGENPTLDTILKVLQYFDEMKALNKFVENKMGDLSNNQSMY